MEDPSVSEAPFFFVTFSRHFFAMISRQFFAIVLRKCVIKKRFFRYLMIAGLSGRLFTKIFFAYSGGTAYLYFNYYDAFNFFSIDLIL
jgi:hypothetical protein